MKRPAPKPFYCTVVSETVSITLRRRNSLTGPGQQFVKCSESECQYVDVNEPPCPLTLDLFAAEIQERLASRSE